MREVRAANVAAGVISCAWRLAGALSSVVVVVAVVVGAAVVVPAAGSGDGALRDSSGMGRVLRTGIEKPGVTCDALPPPIGENPMDNPIMGGPK